MLAIVPLALLAVFFIFIMRQASGAGNQAFSFGKSRARMFSGDRPTVTFDDVAGNQDGHSRLIRPSLMLLVVRVNDSSLSQFLQT